VLAHRRGSWRVVDVVEADDADVFGHPRTVLGEGAQRPRAIWSLATNRAVPTAPSPMSVWAAS
jgi:hypothetical protein